jgi:hypothetical protein
MHSSREATAFHGRSLMRLLTSLMDAAERDVGRLATHEAVATHQLRVRMKKVLALLRLGQDSLPDHMLETMKTHIRAVKNACSPQRDALVREKLLLKLSRRHHLQAPMTPTAALKSPAKPFASFLRHQLCALEQLIETTRLSHLTAEQIVASHALCYRKGRRLMKQAFEGPEGETLHRWRHRVKDLHYQTLALNHLPGSLRRVRRARKLGRILGQEHDLDLLAHDRLYRSARGPWPHLITDCRSRLRERCLMLGHKLFDPAASSFRQRMQRVSLL